jgi:hypothetical protein
MSNHIVLLYTFSDSISFNPKVSVNKQAFALKFVVDDLNFVDSNSTLVLVLLLHLLFLREPKATQIFYNYLVFLIYIDYVNIALFIRCVQFLRPLVPKHASINCFIWILQRNLLSSFRSFEPFESLVIGDRKN